MPPKLNPSTTKAKEAPPTNRGLPKKKKAHTAPPAKKKAHTAPPAKKKVEKQTRKQQPKQPKRQGYRNGSTVTWNDHLARYRNANNCTLRQAMVLASPSWREAKYASSDTDIPLYTEKKKYEEPKHDSKIEITKNNNNRKHIIYYIDKMNGKVEARSNATGETNQSFDNLHDMYEEIIEKENVGPNEKHAWSIDLLSSDQELVNDYEKYKRIRDNPTSVEALKQNFEKDPRETVGSLRI